jgi:hypothetical protein
MSENAAELNPLGLQLEEIRQIREFAAREEQRGFIWVYRGEGEKEGALSGRDQKTGTLFTTNFKHAQDHVKKMIDRGAQHTQVIAVAVPAISADRDDQIRRLGGRMPVGTDIVLVTFIDAVNVRVVDGPIQEIPGPETYVQQFKVVQAVESGKSV